jgi:hypothetical protein
MTASTTSEATLSSFKANEGGSLNADIATEGATPSGNHHLHHHNKAEADNYPLCSSLLAMPADPHECTSHPLKPAYTSTLPAAPHESISHSLQPAARMGLSCQDRPSSACLRPHCCHSSPPLHKEDQLQLQVLEEALKQYGIIQHDDQHYDPQCGIIQNEDQHNDPMQCDIISHDQHNRPGAIQPGAMIESLSTAVLSLLEGAQVRIETMNKMVDDM